MVRSIVLRLGGTIVIAAGALHMSRRLLRLGVENADSELPSSVLPGNQLNFAYIGERVERVADKLCALVVGL